LLEWRLDFHVGFEALFFQPRWIEKF
jgi:hypothetical protein